MVQCTIRECRLDDATAIAEIYGPVVETTTVSFEDVAPSAAEMALRIAQVMDTFPWLVIERDGTLLGYAYAARHRERAGYRYSVDVSVYVASNARRMGAGSALYAELLMRLRKMSFHRVFVGIALPNPPSVALHHKFGFEAVGVYREVGFKFGSWVDVYWCQLAL